MYNERTLQVGFEVRRLSHMKRAVRPRVKMKLKQHRQQPPDSAIFDLLVLGYYIIPQLIYKIKPSMACLLQPPSDLFPPQTYL